MKKNLLILLMLFSISFVNLACFKSDKENNTESSTEESNTNSSSQTSGGGSSGGSSGSAGVGKPGPNVTPDIFD